LHDPGDFTIGDHEDGPASNLFVYPDALNLAKIIDTSDTHLDHVRWSFFGGDGNITINGAVPLEEVNDENILDPPAMNRIDDIDLDSSQHDNNPLTLTFRNTHLSPEEGPNLDPGVHGIVDSQTTTITLFAALDGDFASVTFVVYTDNDGIDRHNFHTAETLIDQNFEESAPAGWAGGFLAGSGTTSTAGGLCLAVPAAGDNIGLWVSPENYIDLIDKTVYRVRMTVSTTQSDPDKIPLWTVDYDNYHTSGFGNNFGGSAWVLDVAGGAQGIGRPQGSTQFDFYLTPNAATTAQWSGQIDPDNSAMSTAAAGASGFRLAFRVLDLGSSPYGAGLDSGEICLRALRVDRIPLEGLTVQQTVFSKKITSAAFAPQSSTQAAEGAGLAVIDDASGSVTYQLEDGSGPGWRKSLIPWDPTQTNGVNYNKELYPIVWEPNTLYRGQVTIHSAVKSGVEGTDPVDIISLGFDTPTSELGATHYTTHGSDGNMRNAASPRLTQSTNGAAQTYTAFFFSQKTTLDPFDLDANRLRFFAEFMNNTAILGAGADPVAIDSMTVDKLVAPE